MNKSRKINAMGELECFLKDITKKGRKKLLSLMRFRYNREFRDEMLIEIDLVRSSLLEKEHGFKPTSSKEKNERLKNLIRRG